MKWSVGTKIGAGFALALAALALLGLTSYRSTSSLIEAAELRSHTFLVLADLQALLSHLRAAESAERGYVIAGEDAYVQTYTEASKAVEPGLQALRKLTADNPNQQRRLDALAALMRARMEQFATVMEQRKNRRGQSVVLPAKGKQTMDEIERVADAIDEEERNLLAVREQRVNLEAQRTLSIIVLGIPIAIALVALAGFWVTRNISVPLGHITQAASQIAAGNLGVHVVPLNRPDEVGKLSNAFADMSSNLHNMAGVAKKIAEGDLTTRIERQSERDALGSAFATMVDNLREVTREIREGANVIAASAGEIVASTSQVASGSVE